MFVFCLATCFTSADVAMLLVLPMHPDLLLSCSLLRELYFVFQYVFQTDLYFPHNLFASTAVELLLCMNNLHQEFCCELLFASRAIFCLSVSHEYLYFVSQLVLLRLLSSCFCYLHLHPIADLLWVAVCLKSYILSFHISYVFVFCLT